ncbi:MAG TPA: hypothetical protein VGS57_19975 [Thermoanaerobaculia bacterium]|nr:hypothetical protein [Thermoanaerobaculia bacterium]
MVTDWRHFSAQFREPFQKELEHLVPPWAVALAMSLYWTELQRGLEDDGLERGVIAVRLITGLVGSTGHFSSFGLRRLGLLLQIVDDLLDFEHDRANGELNCLATGRAASHLAFFSENRQQLLHLFRSDQIMRVAIERADQESQAMTRKLRLSRPVGPSTA